MTNPQPQVLIRAVQDADSPLKLIKAVNALAEAHHPEAIPTLLEVLGYNNPGAAVAAVDGLVQLGDAAVQPLLQHLDGHNYTARAWGVRALAGIGHPSGLETLLTTLKTDFAMSVRRAAARGLGNIRWQEMPEGDRTAGQIAALETLLVASQDGEWIVRYAAIAALHALASALTNVEASARIQAGLQQQLEVEETLAVKARIQLAQQSLKAHTPTEGASEGDWYATLERLYHRKSEERPMAEGDPRKFREVAASLSTRYSAE
jgi:phycocyanobilin lyase subunit beta